MRQDPARVHRRPLFSRQSMGLVYILPWLIGFCLFQLYPFAISLVYSFTDLAIAGDFNFIGLDNYVRLFAGDTDFLKSMGVTIRYVLLVVPGKLLCALVVALLLNMKLRCLSFYRTVYYLPSILGGSVAISALWRVMFMKEGIINGITGLIGLPAVNWLGDPRYALSTISLIEMWQFGSSMVLFLAALKQVPADLYEAASIDGARKPRVFFSITLPMISSVLFFNVIMQTINAMQNFTGAFVVTKGGPVKSTYLMGIKLYEDAFSRFSMGYASAQSWVMFAMILVFTVVLFRTSGAWVYYSDEEGA